jgi:hypothetical protein
VNEKFQPEKGEYVFDYFQVQTDILLVSYQKGIPSSFSSINLLLKPAKTK